jgi:predicted nucleic acid-binding protein
VPATGLVLDASAALAWLIQRVKPAEAQRTQDILFALRSQDAVIPPLWYTEVANGILVAERLGVITESKSVLFLQLLNGLPLLEDTTYPSAWQAAILKLGRAYRLTAYDAVYLELALRTGRTLATFDQQLADSVRKAGGRVFGDVA